MACGRDKEANRGGDGPGQGTRGRAKAGAPSPLVLHLVQVSRRGPCWWRCLTPVPRDAEGRGTSPWGFSPCAKHRFPRDEILLGVHEPNLPSSGSGDHCRGTHEAAAATGGSRHRRCAAGCPAPSASPLRPELFCSAVLTGPGKPVVPGVVLPRSGQPQPLRQPFGALQRVPVGWERTQSRAVVHPVPVAQQHSENSVSRHHEGKPFTVTPWKVLLCTRGTAAVFRRGSTSSLCSCKCTHVFIYCIRS